MLRSLHLAPPWQRKAANGFGKNYVTTLKKHQAEQHTNDDLPRRRRRLLETKEIQVSRFTSPPVSSSSLRFIIMIISNDFEPFGGWLRLARWRYGSIRSVGAPRLTVPFHMSTYNLNAQNRCTWSLVVGQNNDKAVSTYGFR